jgi:hypothetical protein
MEIFWCVTPTTRGVPTFQRHMLLRFQCREGSLFCLKNIVEVDPRNPRRVNYVLIASLALKFHVKCGPLKGIQ